MPEERRSSDNQIIRLETHFKDFVSEYRRDCDSRKDWRDKFEKRVIDIEEDMRKMVLKMGDLGVFQKAIVWLFTITGGAFVVGISHSILDWLKSHWTG